MPKNHPIQSPQTPTLHLHLLGGFAVTLDEQPIHAFRAAKTRALLAYLAVEADRTHSRAALATRLWGELPDAAAKTNLRIELSNLKRVLSAHPALEISRRDVCFRSELATTDVQAFRQEIASFMALPVESQGAALPQLAAAIDRYQGEFLVGFHLDDAVEFEDWQLITREQLHEQMMLALKTLQSGYAEQGHWPQLAEAARRQLALVPWTESAHRNVMQALAAQGQVQAALAHFEQCRRTLQEELGVEPSLPTLELAARLRGEETAPAAVQHNLTQQLKAFVGRKQEIAQLQALVQTEKLVTLLGIGGVGKSHLAQAVAQSVLYDFGDGVWFVPLANIEAGDVASESIALAIAAAIGFQLTNMQSPLVELVAHLATKRMLLVLDNWEHLSESAAVVLDTLLHNTSVHILAMSRVRLQFEGERVVQLAGLPQAEAYTLFLDRARRVVPSFMTDEQAGDGAGENDQGAGLRADILQICEQVAGLPLGIELAASWVEHYPITEIGQSIMQVPVQPQRADGMLQRHHRLNSVFEYSWQLLSPGQQRILARLAIFRGGFDRTAVTAVAESTLNDLSVLIAHSLVQRVNAGRYDLHPLIQEFAAEKLAPQEAGPLYGRHSRHYLAALVAAESADYASRLLADYENVRSGWQHAAQAGDATLLGESVVHFGEFMNQFGLLADGETLFKNAVAQFDGQAAHRELTAQLLEQQRRFSRALWGMQAEREIALRILSITEDIDLQVKAHSDLANNYAEEGDWEQADYHFDRMEERARASSNLATYITAVEGPIHIRALHFRGDLAQGITRIEEMLTLLDNATEPVPDAQILRCNLLLSVSLVAMRYGDYGLSIRYTTENLVQMTALDHQVRRGWILLDLALVEQFAGMYEEAIAHNLEALALAKKTGAADDVGLLQANLCLTMRQTGDLEQALAYGMAACPILKSMNNPRQEGQARNRVGHTLLAMERWADAYATYGEALAVWESQQHTNRYEAVAGRAVAALHLGKHDKALALAEEVIAFVAAEGLSGVVEPVQMLLNCEIVLSALGWSEQAHQALIQAERCVETIAGRISDEAVRNVYLNNRPDNQLLRARLATLA